MVRAITFDAFGTLVDEGPDVLIGIAREICKDHRPQIFQAALRALRANPVDVVHVGNSLREDVAGASRLGMHTIWVNRADVHRTPADPKPDAEVRDLAGLPDTIERVLDPASTARENPKERRPPPSAYRVK